MARTRQAQWRGSDRYPLARRILLTKVIFGGPSS